MKEENKFNLAGSSFVNDVVMRRTKMERKNLCVTFIYIYINWASQDAFVVSFIHVVGLPLGFCPMSFHFTFSSLVFA